ncbi:ribulokinase [Endozoicomonas sp. OPT23]|uniref:ribulokinase n=1 Tax=Endozoicomonas sp. OPT23 TaxID=2072845 RepID=UPI001E284F88|nr:ribulokinase [Endozoicomonas sp. OPT23]
MGEMAESYVIGLDFGSDSGRAVIVDTHTGKELGCGVCNYPRWMEGKYSDAAESRFRHHPLDYIESMTAAIKSALLEAGEGVADKVVGIGVDTTGSTPAPVDEKGEILALKPEFAENPNAMFILWKDHTSVEVADRINTLAKSDKFEDYTKFVGGIYSSEWFLSKAAYVSEQDEAVAKAAHTWVELCDWLPALLSDNLHPQSIKRGICAAGHKALWHESWGGLPPQEFLNAISPTLEGMRANYSEEVYTSEAVAGRLSAEWSEKLGLKEGIAIAVGEFDCHMGAVGAGARAGDLVKVMGTSTCDILMVEPEELGDKTIEGICGQVLGSALPDMVTLEAGQSAFGDIYAWYKRLLAWPMQQWAKDHPEDQPTMEKLEESLLPMLTQAVSQREPFSDGALALDWHNGRRTPYANQRLTGSINKLNLGSDAPEVFHGLVESTAFGAKAITESMKDQGAPIKRVIAIGGISKKSSLVMQMCSDVMGYEIAVVDSEQCCALGAGIFAAVAAGTYATTEEAQKAMASPICQVYHPRPTRMKHYQRRYNAYQQLGQAMEVLTMTQAEAFAEEMAEEKEEALA